MFHLSVYADFMDGVADIVKATLSEEEETVANKSFLQSAKETLGLEKKEAKEEDALTTMTVGTQKILGIEQEEDKTTIEEAMDGIKDSLGIEEGENWGMPSVFGINKKKEHSVFGSTLLGDMKDMGSGYYKGFKYSGQSAEFMSGMVYYNSKLYNNMFDVVDEMPFNVFEEEEETSIFDIFEEGNSVLDMLD